MRFIAILATTMLVILPGVAGAQTYKWEIGGVKAVYFKDGDTPQIEIRMFGIDTPEKAQKCQRANGSCWDCGARATQVLQGLLDNQESTYKFTGEVTYNRPVATIFVGQRDINLEMVRQGYAVVYEGFLHGSMKQNPDYSPARAIRLTAVA